MGSLPTASSRVPPPTGSDGEGIVLPRDVSFDHQARFFDQRAGLPPAASAEVAAALASRLAAAFAAQPAGPSGELVLEIGAGTGEIGAELWRRLPAGSTYLALDLSLGMLALFANKALRDKIPPPSSLANLALVLSDASGCWPLADAAVGAIFCSRAAHRLDGARFLRETRRVLRPGGWLVFGSVERSGESVRAQLQRQMRSLLGERCGSGGPAGRDSRRQHQELVDALGGEICKVTAATFEIHERPADSLAGWRSKRGLAGLDIPLEVQEDVLGRLELWAKERYGDLDLPRPATERYELLCVRPGPTEEKL